MKYCMCHQGEIPMYNRFLWLLSSNEISFADWFNASSVWFTVDPSISYNVRIYRQFYFSVQDTLSVQVQNQDSKSATRNLVTFWDFSPPIQKHLLQLHYSKIKSSISSAYIYADYNISNHINGCNIVQKAFSGPIKKGDGF